MPNLNTHPAAAASASLSIDTQRSQATQPTTTTAVSAAPQAASLSAGEQLQTSYQVRKGDSLWNIAKVKLGDGNKWPELYALNRNNIKNPHQIFPGQVLALPQKVAVAPPATQPALPSPVDPAPASPPSVPVAPPAAEPAPPAVVDEVPISPSPATPAPVAPPAPPATEPTPVASEPPAAPPVATPPAQEQPIYLRPPEELPYPEDPTTPPVPATPAEPVVPPVAAEPAAPSEPAAPTAPPLSTIGQPTAAKSSGVGKAAIIGGVIGTVGTGAALIGITKTLAPPLSNLGGYATAQVVAKGVNSVTTKVGLRVPTGPALTQIVSKVGGPKSAGAVTAIAVGAVVAGVAAGGYYLYNKSKKEEGPAAPANAPQTPAGAASQTPTSAPQTPASAAPQTPSSAPTPSDDASAALGNLQPVIDQNARPPVDQSAKFQQLDSLLKDKKYMFFGAANRPDDIRAMGVQIWLDGTLQDRVKLAGTLVNNGQSELLGRIMGHQETNPLEIAQVMSDPQFPVATYMNALPDNQAFLTLSALSDVALTGEPQSARVIGDTVKAFDRMMDREAPFTRLKQHHQSQGTWEQIPAALRQQIDQLLK